ncbi:hypothetical protein ACHAXH_001827 [Discostella pseudostelligera]
MKHSVINIIALLLLPIFIATTVAFLSHAPTSSRHHDHHSNCFAQKKGRSTNLAKPLPPGMPSEDINLPPDCTMDDLISVMGSGRMKKMARKNRRIRNEKIREGKVVLNEKGEWVPDE